MKFELSQLILNSNINLKLSLFKDLQKQYLTDLLNGHSIDSLNQLYLKQGWLLNFKQLYSLLEYLYSHNLILNNENTQNFFNNYNVQNLSLLNPKQILPEVTKFSWSIDDLPFFRSIEKSIAVSLLKNASVQSFSADQFICRALEKSRDLYILLKGEAAIFRINENKSRNFISLLQANAIFGEAGYFLGTARSADIQTTKKSLVLKIPCEEVILNNYLNKEKIESIQERFWLQQALSKSDFFKYVPAESLDSLLSIGQIVNLEEKNILFQQDDLDPSAYVVIQGSLNVFIDQKFVRQMLQGTFFGEISLMINNGRRSATVIAQSSTKLLKIEQDVFYRLLGQNLHLACVIQNMAEARLEEDKNRTM